MQHGHRSPSAFMLLPPSPLCTIVRTSREDGFQTNLMRWICPWSPLVHSSCGCCAIDQIDAHFEDFEHFCTTHHHRFELQSELLERWIPDQINALNRAVISICPLLIWLLHYYNEKSGRFLKIPSIFVDRHHHRFELQSGLLGRWFLDLFDVVNPSALPICQ